MLVNVNMAFDLSRRRRHQNGKKIAALCMIFFDDEGEGIRKKGPDRNWLRRRAKRGPIYAGIVTELASEDLPSLLGNTF